jgi:hypothetical protein
MGVTFAYQVCLAPFFLVDTTLFACFSHKLQRELRCHKGWEICSPNPLHIDVKERACTLLYVKEKNYSKWKAEFTTNSSTAVAGHGRSHNAHYKNSSMASYSSQ